MNKDDFFFKTQLQQNLKRIAELINSGVFSANILSPISASVFTELMISLNDVLQKIDDLGHRINFQEDISEGDVTDLVCSVRNAVCHEDSGERFLNRTKSSTVKISFSIVVGKGTSGVINERELKSDYDDDIAFFFGEHRIYLKRHIIRSFQKAQARVGNLYQEGNNN